VTFGLTVLVSLVEIKQSSKSSFQACIAGWYFAYLGLLFTGNSVAAAFASYFIESKVPASLRASPLALCALYGFLGVFAFSAIVSRINVTLFDKGVLTIDEWIGKARDNATAASIAGQVRRDYDRVERNARELQELLRPDELATYVQRYCGDPSLAEANKAPNKMLYLALELGGKPQASSIIRERRG
jgi:hypothetical protein